MFALISNTSQMPTLGSLLDSLGFTKWKTIAASCILPVFSFLGAIFCSLSVWVFFRSKFKDPVFVYYRLLCIVYIIHCIQTVPYGFVFSPRYFPQINTYLSSVYFMYYIPVSSFLFHYEDVLQIAILLTRMKMFSPFVKKHFSSKSWIISLTLFLACVCIDIPFAFSIKIETMGTYLTNDNKNETFYYTTSSDFSLSSFGWLFLGFTTFFLNVFLSLVVGVTLNIISYVRYKSYSRERQAQMELLQVSSINNQPTTSREQAQINMREKKEHRIEINMFLMALVLCTISILSRVFIMIAYVYFFFFNTFSDNLNLLIFTFSIFTLVPTVSISVFYSFNQMFRQEFNLIKEFCV